MSRAPFARHRLTVTRCGVARYTAHSELIENKRLSSPRVKHVTRGVDGRFGRRGPVDARHSMHTLTHNTASPPHAGAGWALTLTLTLTPTLALNLTLTTRRSGLGSFDACLFDLAPNEEAAQARRLRALGLYCPCARAVHTVCILWRTRTSAHTRICRYRWCLRGRRAAMRVRHHCQADP